MDIFVDKSKLIEVPVYVWTDQEKVEATNFKKEAKEGYETVVFFCSKPNHKDSVRIMRLAKLGQDQSDAIAFQDAIVKSLVQSVNDGEKATVLDAKKIDDIHPSITRAISAGLLDVVSI